MIEYISRFLIATARSSAKSTTSHCPCQTEKLSSISCGRWAPHLSKSVITFCLLLLLTLLPSPTLTSKRLNEKSIVVVFHPLTSHPGVEDKDGDSVIRGSIQFMYHFTQLDDETVETKMGAGRNSLNLGRSASTNFCIVH